MMALCVYSSEHRIQKEHTNIRLLKEQSYERDIFKVHKIKPRIFFSMCAAGFQIFENVILVILKSVSSQIDEAKVV